jgi:hypothetical protein
MAQAECGLCHSLFYVRVDRWRVKCPICDREDDLGRMRDEWADQKREGRGELT